jgi:F-type H+-transporting ATPase subunit gamma
MQIKSTQAIRKITKSMKMVSAAKFRGDLARLEAGRLFGRSALSLLPDQSYTLENLPTEVPSKKVLIAVLSSDKGLCGGINSFSTKMTKVVYNMMEKKDPTNPPGLFIVGNKSEAQLRRSHVKVTLKAIDECWKAPMNFAVASGMATELLSAARDGSYDEIDLIYNHFKSMIKYETTVQRIPNMELALARTDEVPVPIDGYELEPDSNSEAIQNLYEYSVAMTLFGSAIDNATAEQSARMTAMENATKSAGEMIDKLLLLYNRARQAKITTELIEIISGAESLKG